MIKCTFNPFCKIVAYFDLVKLDIDTFLQYKMLTMILIHIDSK